MDYGNIKWPKLKIPTCPSNDAGKKESYKVHTEDLKMISEYSGLNFKELIDLDLYIDEFRLLYRDAHIYRLNKTEQGRNYLKECWLLEQTNPDRESLRKHFK